jgi:hypothetical protein
VNTAAEAGPDVNPDAADNGGGAGFFVAPSGDSIRGGLGGDVVDPNLSHELGPPPPDPGVDPYAAELDAAQSAAAPAESGFARLGDASHLAMGQADSGDGLSAIHDQFADDDAGVSSLGVGEGAPAGADLDQDALADLDGDGLPG